VVGYFSSSAFSIAGLIAVSLLLGMYLYARIKK
jgi:LPXTG-motif cell wall-anchored protein